MAFVNERITGNDLERYGIAEIKRRIVPGQFFSSSTCTIDHGRDIYLIEAAEERETPPGQDGLWPTGLCGWVFMWHGHELWVEGKWLARGGESGGHRWGQLRLTSLGLMGERVGMLGRTRCLPPELAPQREEILKDLYDALLAYKGFGIHSDCTSYDLQLEIAEGV
jgi:hypothetical protein